MKTVIQNGTILTPEGVIDNGYVVFQDSVILEAGPGTYPGEADAVVDAGGNYVSPGFIDMHTHGAGGADFMDGTVDAFICAAREHMRHGTTSLVPTTLTCTNEELHRALACFKEAKATMADGPNLLGVHLEGPFFSPAQAGAQDPRFLQLPTEENIRALLDASEDVIRVCAAPELPGALDLGDELKKRGILASIGHSDAVLPQVMEAVEHGYSHVTHLYSGMSMLRRIGPYRHLGVVEAAYLSDDLTVEIIADGKHLPPELLRFILKFKPLDKICLITDSMRGAGLPEGSIVKLGSLENGQDVILEDSVAMLMDHTAFAGSICTADRCIRTMHQLAGTSVADAVRMMTENPARVLGLPTKGRLAQGMDADICIFDRDIQLQAVYVMGRKTV